MAEKKKDRERKATARSSDKKPGIGKRLKRFFVNLRAELKRVVWPDRRRLIQSTATVLVILLAAAIMIFVFDNLINLILRSTGFYSPKATTELPLETEITEVLPTSEESP